MPIKVVHLPVIIANQPVILSKYLNRIGVDSKTISYFRTWLRYTGDINLDLDLIPVSERTRRLDEFVTHFLKEEAPKYDVFHFHFFETLSTGTSFGGWKVDPGRGAYWDLQVLKDMGKKIILHNWGSDVRNNSKITYYQLLFEHPGLALPYPPLNRKGQYLKIWKMAQYADVILCGDSETRNHVPYGITLPMAVDDELMNEVASRGGSHSTSDNGKISVLHAPSNKTIKGSRFIMEVLDQIHRQYPDRVDIRLVHGMPYQDALNRYPGKGIAVDQISVGFGLFALEAMSMGRPVLCSVWNGEYADWDPKREAPVYPVLSREELHSRVKEFVEDPSLLEKTNPKGFVLEHFSGGIASRKYKELYERLLANESILSLPGQGWMREFGRLIKGETVDSGRFYPRVTDLLLSERDIPALLGEIENGVGLGNDTELLAKYVYGLERIGEGRRAREVREHGDPTLRIDEFEHHYARARAIYEQGEVFRSPSPDGSLASNGDHDNPGGEGCFEKGSDSPKLQFVVPDKGADVRGVLPIVRPDRAPSKDRKKGDPSFPKVTVLISTYNRPESLKEAIQSVVVQEMENWELLVMNDGGKDVRHVVEGFRDDRISYLHDEMNRGLAFRLNVGLKQARGDYIAYLGDDDLWYPCHLELLSRALDEDPEIGAVYSDLYGVQCVIDKETGRRYPLNKIIQASRDYNRDAMFCFNHTLHVSLMHRKGIALRAGGYDESIRVMIDWNLTRKLSFYTDFKHLSKLTGEYYMPIKTADRISNRERQDKGRYRHNLRKIMADLPPEPWTRVDTIAVIFPVSRWEHSITSILTNLADRLYYPVRFILVNNDLTKDEAACRRALGEIGELKNILIHTPPRELKELEAYRFGANRTRAEYVYLLTKNVDTSLEMRLLSARYFLKRKQCQGIKWDVEQEKKGPFDVLIKRSLFLNRTSPGMREMDLVIDVVPRLPPDSLRCDFFLKKAKEAQEAGNPGDAYLFLSEAEAVKTGGAEEQYTIDLHNKICFDLGRYDEAEQKCRQLIEKGYGADNWVRLGKILQIKGRYREAVQAFDEGLHEIGLTDSDLKSSAFPIVVSEDFGSFSAYIGLGECLLETGDLVESSKAIHRAAKLKADSHRPFLAFGKLFLKTGEFDRAKEALLLAARMDGQNAEIGHLLDRIDGERRNPPAEVRPA
jgi:glycosyltransferase involved in cell wall biosynthesis